VDIAQLGLAVDSSQVAQGAQKLDTLTESAKRAETAAGNLGRGTTAASAGAKQLAGAAEAEARALTVATAAANMNSRAVELNGAATRAAAMQQRNLVFQLNDTVVSLASGMSLQMVALQQGSQIFQNGIGNAFKSLGGLATGLVTKFAPFLPLVAALGVGIASVTTEINRGQKTAVSWTDVLQGSFSLLADGVYREAKPALNWLAGVWDVISQRSAASINGLIQNVVLAYRDIKTQWSYLPNALGEITIETAQNVLNAIADMLTKNKAQIVANLMSLGSAMGPIFGSAMTGAGSAIQALPAFTAPKLDNPYTGATNKLQSELTQNRTDVYGTDYIGAIGDRARKLALAATETAADKASKAVKGLADKGFAPLTQATNDFADAAKSAFSNLGTGIMDAFKKGGNVAMNILDMLLGKVGDFGTSLLNSGLNALLNGAISGLTGGATGGAWGSGLWGSAIFKAGGGAVSGRGTGTSDSVPAMLSNGEFVVNARSASAFGPLLEAINRGIVPRLSGGGFLGAPGGESGVEFNGAVALT
jgi:hypothetical protein